jgi:hypothetical protein
MCGQSLIWINATPSPPRPRKRKPNVEPLMNLPEAVQRSASSGLTVMRRQYQRQPEVLCAGDAEILF